MDIFIGIDLFNISNYNIICLKEKDIWGLAIGQKK